MWCTLFKLFIARKKMSNIFSPLASYHFQIYSCKMCWIRRYASMDLVFVTPANARISCIGVAANTNILGKETNLSLNHQLWTDSVQSTSLGIKWIIINISFNRCTASLKTFYNNAEVQILNPNHNHQPDYNRMRIPKP